MGTTFFFVLCESCLGGLWAGESALRLTMEGGQGVQLSGDFQTQRSSKIVCALGSGNEK